jgi:hypothetical protein
VDLSALPGGGTGYTYGAADAINASGQVTGSMSIGGTFNAFLYTGGTVVYNIGPNIASAPTHGTGINASGQISAFYGVPQKTGYFYTGGTAGTATTLSLPGGTTGDAGGAMSISDAGDVVGYAKPADTTGDVGALFYRSATSTSYELARPTGPGYDGYRYDRIANAISPNGNYVVGRITYAGPGMPPPLPTSHAAYWTYSINGSGVMTSTVTDLGAAIGFPGDFTNGGSEVLAVNNAGQMVGLDKGTATGEMGTVYHDVWLYHFGDATYTDLTTTAGLYENRTGGKTMTSGANLINRNGQVVGEMNLGTTDAPVWNAAIWDTSNGLRNLNALYAADLAAWSAANGGATVVLNDAQGINDKGAIVGIATINGTANQVFVLTPPEVLLGDANLDGTVNISDLSKVLTNYDKSGMVWSDGDFDGNGAVDITDLSKVLTNYDKSAGASVGINAVPEPSTLVLVVVGAIGLLAYAGRERAA